MQEIKLFSHRDHFSSIPTPEQFFYAPTKKPRLHCSRALHAVQSHFVNILRASRLRLIDFVLFRNFRSENDEIVVHFAMLIYSCR